MPKFSFLSALGYLVPPKILTYPGQVIQPVVLPEGNYSTITIDPPWPMKKIERKVRPRQHGFDYPPMSFAELTRLNVRDLSAKDAHLYCWATHKHLPWAFELVKIWGFKYECLMTWNKNVGFTPFSWMRDTEHVLFCRRGNLPLLRKGLRLSFSGRVREHSRKPDEFYQRVVQASPGPRIDIFAREQRTGWDTWGDETDKFSNPLE